MQNTKESKELLTKVEFLIHELAEETDKTRASDFFKKYLEVMTKFYSYSWHNQLLIYLQAKSMNLEPTKVMGFRQWNGMNRTIKKSESGIKILVPVFGYFDTEKHKLHYDKAEKLLFCDDCERHYERGEVSKMVQGFSIGYVFDVSQTEGEELPEIEIKLDGNSHKEMLEILEDFCVENNIAVVFKEIVSERLYGYSQGGKIVVKQQDSINTKINTLLHEIAHELLHYKENNFSKQQKEIQAEAIAYVVCKHFGLNAKSFNYLALYDADYRKIMENLRVISQISKGLIGYISQRSNERPILASV